MFLCVPFKQYFLTYRGYNIRILSEPFYQVANCERVNFKLCSGESKIFEFWKFMAENYMWFNTNNKRIFGEKSIIIIKNGAHTMCRWFAPMRNCMAIKFFENFLGKNFEIHKISSLLEKILQSSFFPNFINNEAHLQVKVFTMSSWIVDVITMLSSAPSDTLWSWN